ALAAALAAPPRPGLAAPPPPRPPPVEHPERTAPHASSITRPLTLASKSSGTLGRPSSNRSYGFLDVYAIICSLESIHCACAQNVPSTSDAIAGVHFQSFLMVVPPCRSSLRPRLRVRT